MFQAETLDLPQRKYDCVFAKEFMSGVDDKRTMIQQIEKSLKYGGHFMIIDFTIEDGDRRAAEVRKWLKTNDSARRILSQKATTERIAESGLENRVARDITDRYVEMIGTAWRSWQDVVEEIDHYVEREAILNDLLGQARVWTELIEILRAGNLRVFSYHATKRSSGGIR